MVRILLLLIFSFVNIYPLYAQSEQVSELSRDYNRLMQSQPNNVEAHRDFIAKWKSRNSDLISIYEKAISASPESPVLKYALGYVYTSMEDGMDKAIDLFQKAIEADKSFPMAHFSLGSMYLKNGDYKLAEIEFQKSIDLADNPAAYYNLGEVYRLQKQYDLALIAYKKALGLKQDWGFPYYGIGMVYFDQGKYDSAEIEFKQALKHLDLAMAHFKLGQIYAMQDLDIETISKEYREGQKAIKEQNLGGKDEQQAFYDLGKIFAQNNKAGLAIQAYKNAINIDSGMAEAQFELGNEYYKMGLKERAMEHYKAAIQADASIRRYFLDEAKKYYESGDFDNAASLLDKSLSIVPDDAESHYYYAQILTKSGNTPEATNHYEDTIRIDPNFAGAYIPLGDIYYSSGRKDEAAKAYRKAISLGQKLDFISQANEFLKSADSSEKEGDLESRANEIKTARTYIEKHLMIYPDDSDAYNNLGITHERLDEMDKAMEYYQKAVELSPSRYDILLRIASVYKEKGMLSDSLTRLSLIIGNDNIDDQKIKADAYRMAAAINESMGNFGDAMNLLENAVRIDPSDAQSYYKLGLFYEEKISDIDRAMEKYEAVISLDQTKADPYLRLGAIYVKKGSDDSKIIDVYEKGLAIDPKHPQIQYDLALLYKKKGDLDKAIEHYQVATELSPDDYKWHYEYAKLLDGKDNSEAIEEYTRVIELKRDFAPAYYDRAMLIRKAKAINGRVYRNEQIIEDLKQAAELDPKMADAYYNIALLYKEMEASEMAREYFEKTIRANPSYLGVHLQLGLIAEQKGEYTKAMEEYKKEVGVNSTSALAYQRLGFLYSNDKEDFQKGEEEFVKSLALDPDNVDTLIHYANNLYTIGKLGQSADQFEKALQLDPKNPTANYNLALVYEKWGKKKLAIEQWQKFLKMDPPGSWATEARKHLKELGAK